MPAGKADADGNYPVDSINGMVQATLARFAETARAFALSDRDGGK